MNVLDYIKAAQAYRKGDTRIPGEPLRVAIVTNFTDDLLEKIFVGVATTEGIPVETYRVPFGQYAFALKNVESELYAWKPDITFIFFDVAEYLASPFSTVEGHADAVIDDIIFFSEHQQGLVVVHTLTPSPSLQADRIFKTHTRTRVVEEWNYRLGESVQKIQNLLTINTATLFARHGGHRARDLRGIYAFAQPFTGDFFLDVAFEWVAYLRSLVGKVKKCIVLDLDNTLWGGVLGEVGPHGIEIGHEYPGNAFRAFQTVLLDLYHQGIILALNSRNNIEDVREVFLKNPHMVLTEDHFGSMMVNWNDKATNLRHIADELDIGLDSMIFIDDDPANRHLVRQQIPEVLVPEFTLRPEEYVHTLINLDVFHGHKKTHEDSLRGKMYSDERKRRELHREVPSFDEYLKSLNIVVTTSVNDEHLVSRVAQLTQKTNQYNLTTYRASEGEVEAWMRDGLVYTGSVEDTFGPYGVSVLLVAQPEDETTAVLTVFLMSCRVAGRGVEDGFFRAIMEDLHQRGYQKVKVSYTKTAKNAPVATFLERHGLSEGVFTEAGHHGVIDLSNYVDREKMKTSLITVSILS